MKDPKSQARVINALYNRIISEGRVIAGRKAGSRVVELYLLDDTLYEIYRVGKTHEVLGVGTEVTDEALSAYIDAELERRRAPLVPEQPDAVGEELQEDEEPAFIPVCCPFTGAVAFDEKGYRDPLPETLVMVFTGNDHDWYGRFEFVEELSRYLAGPFIDKVWGAEKWEKDVMRKKVEKEFPWFDWQYVVEGEVPFEDTLDEMEEVFGVSNDNAYDGMASDTARYYFVRKEDLERVKHDLQRLHRLLKEL